MPLPLERAVIGSLPLLLDREERINDQILYSINLNLSYIVNIQLNTILTLAAITHRSSSSIKFNCIQVLTDHHTIEDRTSSNSSNSDNNNSEVESSLVYVWHMFLPACSNELCFDIHLPHHEKK